MSNCSDKPHEGKRDPRLDTDNKTPDPRDRVHKPPMTLGEILDDEGGEGAPDNAWPLDNCPPSPPAPSISDAHVENSIKSETYLRIEGTNVTICCITMRNGFTVVGQSHCVSADNFDRRVGNDIARRDATAQIWGFLGYVLKDRLYHAQGS